MIEQFTQYPVGIFTTVQPFLFVWVMAISFFVSVSIVALLMKDRTKTQIFMMSVGVFTVVLICATAISTWVVGVSVVDTEVIWIKPAMIDEENP